MSPVASDLASMTGSCSWGTITVVPHPIGPRRQGPSSVTASRDCRRRCVPPAQRRKRALVDRARPGTQHSFLFGGVIYGLDGALIGLRPVADDTFDENRVGLDHIAFQTASKAELDGAATHLDQLGIHHEPVKDIGPSYILEFRGPDNIALELTAPK